MAFCLCKHCNPVKGANISFHSNIIIVDMNENETECVMSEDEDFPKDFHPKRAKCVQLKKYALIIIFNNVQTSHYH